MSAKHSRQAQTISEIYGDVLHCIINFINWSLKGNIKRSDTVKDYQRNRIKSSMKLFSFTTSKLETSGMGSLPENALPSTPESSSAL